jgi:hypothetical protein
MRKPYRQKHNDFSQMKLNVGFSLEEKKKGITDELINAIVMIAMFHVGRENAISRTNLVREIHARGFHQDERTIRIAISEMRRQLGIPIAGTGGKNGGYWLLKDKAESDAYCAVQLHDPGVNLLEQESSVQKNINRWYPNGQLSLPAQF